MARRRTTIPPIAAPKRRGIASSAYDRHVSGGGFGTPGSGRQIRQYPVETQQEIVARERERAAAAQRARTARGIVAVMQGDDSQLFTVDLAARSSNPQRPRALAGGYDSASETVRIRFRPDGKHPEGAVYEYYQVPRNAWKNMLRANSPGRYIDRVLDTYPYTQVGRSFQPQAFFQAPQ